MTDWQPIDTAPKDGTAVLLHRPNDYAPVTGCWGDRRWNLCEMGDWASDNPVQPKPTHWMPLPDPPEDE